MRAHAFLASRPLRITGWPHSGWRAADEDDPSARVPPFRFAITDDDGGYFLLAYQSLDGIYSADRGHESLADALAMTEDRFGIRPGGWSRPRSAHGGSR